MTGTISQRVHSVAHWGGVSIPQSDAARVQALEQPALPSRTVSLLDEPHARTGTSKTSKEISFIGADSRRLERNRPSKLVVASRAGGRIG